MSGPSVSVRRAAIDLADVLERISITPDQAEQAEPYVWAMAGELAGHKDTPSDELRERAVRLLRSREANPDPFAAFRQVDPDLAAVDRIARSEDMATMAGEADR